MISNNTKAYKYLQAHAPAECPICKRLIYAADAEGIEYVKTRRGSHIYLCTKHFEKED